MSKHARSGIRVKLLGLAIVPVIIVALVLGYYLITTRIHDAHSALINKGDLITNNFAPAVEFALFTQNISLLRSLSLPILRDPEVISVTIYDQQKKQVLYVESDQYPTIIQAEVKENVSVFQSAVVSTRLLTEDFGDAQVAPSNRNIGWVEVKMTHYSLNQRQSEIVFTSLMLVLAVLLVCIYMVIRFGVRVSNPILALTLVVDEIRNGNLDARINENENGELGRLQSGVNAMAETIQASHSLMKDEIEVSTIALRHTVNALEEKNNELEHATQDLEEAIKAKSEFLAKMSHEIRTPLNALIGFTRLIEKSTDQSELEEYTRTIKHAGSQLLTVIDDILSFSKLEKADVQFQIEPFDLRDALEDVLSLFSPLARAKELQLILLIDLDVPSTIMSDSLRINQVLSNLINNALKFTTEGSVTVRVSLRKEQDNEVFIRFVVNDTGIGIQPEEKKLLFKAFSQLDSNFSRQYEGAGLGLAISKRIIELMLGNIGVDSVYGKGSSFWFEIPCKTGYEARGILGAALANHSVLLFDLQPTSRLAIRNHFLSWQANLYLAKSEQELYERLADKTLKFDLVVISLGYESTSHKSVEIILQNINSKYRGKVILLVFSNYQNLKNLYVFRGDVMILEKPMRKHKLFERIMDFLNISSKKQQLQKERDMPEVIKSGAKALPVLVAEDNEFNAILISAMLEERGYEVTCRSSGKEILSLLPDHKYILFFIDIHMPDMDGYELVSKCRREKLIGDKVPVIAFTADIMLRQIDSLREHGFNDVLYKPVSNENLDRLLSKWIEHRPDTANNVQGSSLINSFDLKQQLNDDIRQKIIYLKKNIKNLDSENVAEQIHQLEGLLGYFQLKHLLVILNELKQAILDKDRHNAHLKLELLESETITID